MTLSFNLNDMRNNIYKRARNNLLIMRHKTKTCKLDIYQAILNIYARSLIHYQCTPAVASGQLNIKSIRKLENKLIKDLLIIPKNISGSLVNNTFNSG